MPLGCCWAGGVKIPQNPFHSEVGAPFEVPTSYGFYEGRYLRAAQGLVCKADAICLVHGGRDDSVLSAKLIRIAPETSSF